VIAELTHADYAAEAEAATRAAKAEPPQHAKAWLRIASLWQRAARAIPEDDHDLESTAWRERYREKAALCVIIALLTRRLAELDA
jgi:ferric-dicitrate binding protein FerR (iron transport regulator)